MTTKTKKSITFDHLSIKDLEDQIEKCKLKINQGEAIKKNSRRLLVLLEEKDQRADKKVKSKKNASQSNKQNNDFLQNCKAKAQTILNKVKSTLEQSTRGIREYAVELIDFGIELWEDGSMGKLKILSGYSIYLAVLTVFIFGFN